ncbi:squalene/phytoene synthase family protein [Candidatus Woesearchaeota archaeon]|nr:squalene/phytoene synthase family protein [Candidatus Woesearchaeota archaeon]
MDVEIICLEEAIALAQRDSKYWLLLAHMYGKSIFDPEGAKLMRAAYFFCRHIDDVLDGDRKITEDPKGYVEEIKDAMKGGKSKNKIIELYKYAIKGIEKRKRGGDNPENEFERVTDAMLFDYERSQRTQFLSRERIEQYYDDTFTPVVNISLMIARASVRGDEIPEIVYSMGHLYSIRDMERDISEGIVNIPYEEISAGRFDVRRIISYERVRRNQNVRHWMDEEVRTYGQEINKWKKEAGEEMDIGTRRVCHPLIRGMESFCKKYWKESTYK